jgi:hypothetical protein
MPPELWALKISRNGRPDGFALQHLLPQRRPVMLMVMGTILI